MYIPTWNNFKKSKAPPPAPPLFLFCSCFSQMSIFMSQGLWEMLPRATRGQSLPSSIPGELSMSARGQHLVGRTQPLLSLHPVVCPLKWRKILYSTLLYKMSTQDEQCIQVSVYPFGIKTDADADLQKAKMPELCK